MECMCLHIQNLPRSDGLSSSLPRVICLPGQMEREIDEPSLHVLLLLYHLQNKQTNDNQRK